MNLTAIEQEAIERNDRFTLDLLRMIRSQDKQHQLDRDIIKKLSKDLFELQKKWCLTCEAQR